MYKNKQSLMLLLSIVMLFGLLSACGKNNKEDTASSGTQGGSQQASSGASPSGEKTFTIDWLAVPLNAPVPDDAKMKKYWEQKFNVKFNMWYVERAKWSEILNVKIASGEFPDVLYVENPDMLSSYYKQGLLLELSPETLEQYAPNIAAAMNQAKEDEGVSPFIATKISGKNYGIPLLFDRGRYPFVSIWRKDWLDKVGITKLPQTLDEYEQAFYKIAKDDPDGNNKMDTYALSSGYNDNPFASIFGAFGYIPEFWTLKDGKLVYGAVQPEMKAALGYLQKWYKDKLINPEFITGENRGGHWSISQDFVDNIIGYSNNGPFYQDAPPEMTPSGSKMYAAFAAAHNNDAKNMVIGPPPVGPNGASGSVRVGLVTGESLVFSKKLEKDPEKLHKILQVLNDLGEFENWKLAFYGIEGEDYTVENGAVKSLLPKGTVNEQIGIGPTFVPLEIPGSLTKFNPKYFEYADSVAGFTNKYTNLLLTRVPSADKYLDELDKLRRQAYLEIIMGKKPLDYFDEFVKKWYASGGTQISEEANAWYASVQ